MNFSPQRVAQECLRISLEKPEDVKKALLDKKVGQFNKLAKEILEVAEIVGETNNLTEETLQMLGKISENKQNI